jgi:hypothetical protein
MKRIYGTAVLAALFALAAAAQDADIQKKMADADMQKKMAEDLNTEITNMRVKVIGMVGGVMSNVKNAPYQADQITETTQTLGDGTRIHNEHQVTLYRDSQGRVRRELPEEISIMDPNSGVSYTLNTKSMTARKMQVSVSVNSGNSDAGVFAFRTLTVTGASTMAGGGRGGEDMPMTIAKTVLDGAETATVTLNGQTVTVTPNKESLGTQTMEGVSAKGERQTRTMDAGEIGYDRPMQIVSEHWYSPDLQMDVMTRHSDPRTGEEITRLININRAEPDPSLFQVPAGYQIVEGPGAKGGRGGRGGGQ